jgi:PE-PPE domain
MSMTAVALTTALVFSPAPALPPATYVLGGTGLPGMSMSEESIAGFMSGYLTGGRELPYPHSLIGMNASIDTGANAILHTIESTDGPVRIAGISQGALSISAAKSKIMALPEDQRPASDQLVFVTMGDPSSAGGLGGHFPGLYLPVLDVTFLLPPDTPYHTITVNREYDGFADFPDRPLNLLATANALAGIIYVHPYYGDGIDLLEVPAGNITETTNGLGGKTTTYLVPTENLPLLQPLRDLDVDERIVEAIETPLKRIVDAGYARNDDTADVTDSVSRAGVRPLRADSAGHNDRTQPDRSERTDRTERASRTEHDRSDRRKAERDRAE